MAPNAATVLPGSVPIVEVLIRTKGTRRQAYYRQNTPGQGPLGWKSLQVPHAERAVRSGTMTLAGGTIATVVSRETQDEVPA